MWFCCCEDCTIASDDFNRADSTSIGAAWTEVHAEWAIEGNRLAGTAARALVIHNTLHPDGDAGLSRVTVTMTPDYTAAATNKGRLLTAYTDDGDYLFVEAIFIEDDCTTIRLGSRVATVETWLTDALPVATGDDDTITLSLCWQPPTGSGSDAVAGQLEVSVSGQALTCLFAETSGAGDQVGMELTLGEVFFDNFIWTYHEEESHPTCPECDCTGVCTIFTDSFTDRTTLGCWTQDDATVSVADDVMTLGSGGSEVTADAIPQSDEDAIRVVSLIRTDDSTATLRIKVGQTDTNNYLFAEIALASGTVTARLGKRVASVDSYLTAATTLAGVDLTDPTEVQVCWRPGEFLGEAEESQLRYPTLTSSGTGGLGTQWSNPENIEDNDEEEAKFIWTQDDENTPSLIAGGFLFHRVSVEVEHVLVDGGALRCRILNLGNELDSSNGGTRRQLEQSDDMATGGTVPNQGSNGTMTWGGDADLSGGDPTWDEINSDTFQISMIWRTTTLPNSNAPIEVDWVTAEVFYTTPPREPGRLEVTVNGTCVREFDITHDTGSQVGFRAASGEWEIDDFVLTYEESVERPNCPECCPDSEASGCTGSCCDPTALQYAVTIGVNTFILDFDGDFGGTSGLCIWRYSDPTACGGDGLNISLDLYRGGLTIGCRWILITSSTDGADRSAFALRDEDDPAAFDCDGTITLTHLGDVGSPCVTAADATIVEV